MLFVCVRLLYRSASLMRSSPFICSVASLWWVVICSSSSPLMPKFIIFGHAHFVTENGGSANRLKMVSFLSIPDLDGTLDIHCFQWSSPVLSGDMWEYFSAFGFSRNFFPSPSDSWFLVFCSNRLSDFNCWIVFVSPFWLSVFINVFGFVLIHVLGLFPSGTSVT